MDDKQQVIERRQAELNQILGPYEAYQDLMGVHHSNLLTLIQRFTRDAEHARQTDRTLRIAIVGQVNAGKSSFLNAAIFQGRGILPKAATPMTAALSIIRYAPETGAEVEFYDVAEWQKVRAAAQDYESRYAETRQRLEREVAERASRSGLFGRELSPSHRSLTSSEILAAANIPEENKAAYELVTMAKKNQLDIDKYLGKTQTLDNVNSAEELMAKLADYVGVDGHYTPIVRSTTIYYNDPLLKDVEIVDTPGINDPVISRGRKTREFLGQCDVVFVLSYCGQFVDGPDLEILAQNLPSSGIKDMVLVGTQLDSAMLQEYHNYRDITDLLDNLEVKLERHAMETFDKLEKKSQESREREILQTIKSALPPIFVSSMAYSIAQHFDQLSKEESHFLNLYNEMYPGLNFDPELLLDLSNIPMVVQKLDQQKEKKDEILQQRFQELLKGTEIGLGQELRDLHKHATRNLELLKQTDIQDLQEKEKGIVGRVHRGQDGIEAAFEHSIVQVKKDFSLLLTEVKQVARDFEQLKQSTETTTENYRVSTSKWYKPWSWGSSETRTRTISYRYADTHDAIDKVEEFAYESERRLKEAIIKIINLPVLRAKIKDATMSLFDLSDENFNVDDVTVPVERAVNRITIPEIEFGKQDYSAKISSQFSGGRVSDSAVDQLQEAQRKAIRLVVEDFNKAVEQKTVEIGRSLEMIQGEYVVSILEDIHNDLKQLREQLQDKEASQKRYQLLLKQIDKDLAERNQ